MVNASYDEKFTLKLSLQVMSELRQKLINDTINVEPKLHVGLHKSDSPKVRDLYIESYLVSWLNGHWNEIDSVLQKHDEYSKDARKWMTIYFARYSLEIFLLSSVAKFFD